jgi:hypothetical protein
MARQKILAMMVLLVTVGWTEPGRAWNEVGHRRAVQEAIEDLPKPLKNFYKDRRDLVMERLTAPGRIGPRMTFEVDRLEEFPFETLPVNHERAVRKFGEDKLEEVGDLPWKLIESYQALVEAFKEVDTEAIVERSVEVAVYVDELHQPLNISKWGDGESIDQEGMRERFDSRLLDLYGDKLDVDASTAVYLDRPAEFVMSILRRSYVWVDNLLLYDYMARQGVSSYDRFYYEGLWLLASSIVDNRLSDSSKDMASYWYTAWTQAGKPDLPKPGKSNKKK